MTTKENAASDVITLNSLPGNLKLVVLLEDKVLFHWLDSENLRGQIWKFEKYAALREEDRTDQIKQAQVRAEIARQIRNGIDGTHFSNVIAPGCLWLAFCHWSSAESMWKGLETQLSEKKSAIITIAIASSSESEAVPDTAWSFMIGDRIHDGRSAIRKLPPGQVKVYENEAIK